MNATAETAMDRKKVTVHMPPEVYERLKALAVADRRSLASWALMAIEERLERLKVLDQKTRPGRGAR
jgi:predicted DNA-binding protein